MIKNLGNIYLIDEGLTDWVWKDSYTLTQYMDDIERVINYQDQDDEQSTII